MTQHKALIRPDGTTPLASDEFEIAARLRSGDERVFAQLIEQHHLAMVRMATVYVADNETAEEVAQDTWLHVLQSIDQFEGRSTLKTWIFGILINMAKRRGLRERRIVPFSALWGDEDVELPAVDPARFYREGEIWANHWKRSPMALENDPEAHVLSAEMRATIERTVTALPINQRQVFWLRDVEGWTAAELCALLKVSEANQRVLLHRARSQVRGALERYWEKKVRSKQCDE